MTLQMQVQNDVFDAYQTVNLVTQKADAFKLQISYSHPARLSWTMFAPNHTTPLQRLSFVRFWDTELGDENGNGQSASNPMFEGWIEEVRPGQDGHTVEYVAYDPTRRAANEVTVMSTAWQQGAVASGVSASPPEEGIGAVPRLVYNAKIDNDPDYSHAKANDYTIGEMIGDILTDQYQPLYWCNAAPGDGSSAGNGVAFQLNTGSGTGGGTELANMDFKPQEKMVFESESVRSAIDRLMQQHEPNFRLLWEPGPRKWRFVDLTTQSQQTLTLNEFDGTYKVLSLNLEPSLEGCYTAVKLYGPETTVVAAPGGDVDAFTTDGSAPTLTALGSGIVMQNYVTSGGSFQAIAYTRYQIVDSTKRRGAKSLSRTVTVPMDDWQYIPVKSPTVQISFDFGATWMTVLGAFFDFQNGIVDLVNPLYFWFSSPPIFGSTQQFFPPTTVRLLWAYYSDPLSVRKPTSGYEGTANTVAGLRNVYRQYDESIAVGYEYGTAVTSATRLAQMGKLAQKLLDERKDIRYSGGCTLEGLKTQFLRLGKRINFAAINSAGGALTTGWESINAWLTDVEYDFASQLTTLTFSSDQLELIGVDVEMLKQALKIKALEPVVITQTQILYHTEEQKWGSSATLTTISGVAQQSSTIYVDPETGEQG